jgi:hypothetical protein
VKALSHCRKKNARILRLEYFQATATAARHMFIADGSGAGNAADDDYGASGSGTPV